MVLIDHEYKSPLKIIQAQKDCINIEMRCKILNIKTLLKNPK